MPENGMGGAYRGGAGVFHSEFGGGPSVKKKRLHPLTSQAPSKAWGEVRQEAAPAEEGVASHLRHLRPEVLQGVGPDCGALTSGFPALVGV